MTLEIRPAAAPQSFDLFEDNEKIGEIRYVPAFEEWGELCPEQWEVEVWSLMGTGKVWKDSVDTGEEAAEEAERAYVEFVAERRKINQSPSRVRTVSTPMGGQRRR
ncbi:hypothetical protein [Streptomyces sp. LN245]|uniref:hypothetical protein n=1 Tax=Streptomyces sp. LN245 TaxID=3112975 RepID=UPI00371F7770